MRARDEISAALPDADVRVEVCDVSDLAGVRAFAADLAGRLSRLELLVHNAGVLPATRTETGKGHEITLATHVLGPVLLTEFLAAGARQLTRSAGDFHVLGWDVHPGAARRRPRIPQWPIPRRHRLCAHETDAGSPDSDPRRTLGGAAHLGVLHAPRVGRHTGGGRRVAGLSHAHRPAAALTRRRRRYRGVARRDHTGTANRPVFPRVPSTTCRSPGKATVTANPFGGTARTPSASITLDRPTPPIAATAPAARARRSATAAAGGARGAWPPGTPARSPRPRCANRSRR